jgi:hypothetical protein
VNSSSRAISRLIWDVKSAFGELSNRCASICSEILSRFCWDIWGIYVEGGVPL